LRRFATGRYLAGMAAPLIRGDGFVDPCIPTLAAKPHSGPGWVREIKHDGYRLIARRDGAAVRLFTRRGHDWTDRYPAIAAAAAKLRAKSFTLDGEAAVTGEDGVAVHSTAGTKGSVLHRGAGLGRARARDQVLAFGALNRGRSRWRLPKRFGGRNRVLQKNFCAWEPRGVGWPRKLGGI
jgi:ATP dependent DNA ligase domain